ncbi:Myb-like protein L [Pseudolycoriella hygida]|uniref:Myb-like protein L n=1 Tax=Pseudolycoriella hygida TaxID=35572 RepID=A0A9Q0MRX7_9DIPT|nr:Myb-like protein L [Pseudolycoriella hygida]
MFQVKTDIGFDGIESADEENSNSNDDTETEESNDLSFAIAPKDYVNEAKTLIYANETITNENALAINQQLQLYLKEVKRKLEALLITCREKYNSNERLKERIKSEMNAAKKDLRSMSYSFCGKPYFKQMDLFSAPLNSDYLYRKNVQHEYFPIDHLDAYKPWSAKDKLFLINGVKDQVLKFLKSNQKDLARQVKSNTRQGAKKRKSILDDRSWENRKLHEMLEVTNGTDFQIDWFTISTKDLDDRHSVNECMGIWMNNLMPSLNRLKWTEEDDDKLLKVAEEFNCQNWEFIGKEMDGRSGYDCIIRYQGLINDQNVLRNCRWTKQEDQALKKAVETCRIGSFIPWSKVGEKLHMRTKMQAYHRYMFTLRPNIKKEKFTVEEDCIITAAIKQYGKNFHKISANLLPGRTLVQIRHRYCNVLKHVDKFKEWSVEDDIKLMELTEQLGTSDWANISKQLIHHTRLSCRSRYITIKKFLGKNPHKEVKDVPRRARKQSTNVKEDNWMEEIINYKKKKFADTLMAEHAGRPNTVAGIDFHEYFKFSYNFQLEPMCGADDPASDKCRAMSYILENTVYPKDHKLFYGETDCRIDMASMIISEDTDEYLFPPEWSTVLLLRGLSILFTDTKEKPKYVYNDTPALQLFRKRFFMLLYSTAVASHTTIAETETETEEGQETDSTIAIFPPDFGMFESKRRKH